MHIPPFNNNNKPIVNMDDEKVVTKLTFNDIDQKRLNNLFYKGQ